MAENLHRRERPAINESQTVKKVRGRETPTESTKIVLAISAPIVYHIDLYKFSLTRALE